MKTNKIRSPKKYKDVGLALTVFIVYLVSMTLCISAQAQSDNYYEHKTIHKLPGIVAIAATPVSFVAVELNHNSFVQSYGSVEPYMEVNKLTAYNRMMNNNNTILITGIAVAATGFLIQHLVNKKLKGKKRYTRLPCISF